MQEIYACHKSSTVLQDFETQVIQAENTPTLNSLIFFLASEVPTYRNMPSYLFSLKYFLNLIPFFFISVCSDSPYHFRNSMTNIHSHIKGYTYVRIMRIYEFPIAISSLKFSFTPSLSFTYQVFPIRYSWLLSLLVSFTYSNPSQFPLFFFFSYFQKAFTISHTIFSFLYMNLLGQRN